MLPWSSGHLSLWCDINVTEQLCVWHVKFSIFGELAPVGNRIRHHPETKAHSHDHPGGFQNDWFPRQPVPWLAAVARRWISYTGFPFQTVTPIIMQGISILVLTFTVLYLGRKLLSFVKALQAIRYVNNLMVHSNFYLLQYSQVPPRETYSRILGFCRWFSTENMEIYWWGESFIRWKT
jgi:hypothetical protein